MIKVRFAPSPTGPLHVGGARAALFNWLFVKSKGGKFVLRIEDTDRERSKKEFEDSIVLGLKWLGLDWDEFYRQSERIDIYRDQVLRLIKENKAYYCFCNKEDLEAERQAHQIDGSLPKYSGKCRNIPKDEADNRKVKEHHVIRFIVPEREVVFEDLIRGEIKFDSSLMGDIVIAKSVDQPLFNFAVVVDDALMDITHVIRGEDHISNTPKHILIAEALEFKFPEFAHLPLILNPDRSKMSKRFSDVAVADYQKLGYISEAMINFLAFLGWHPKDDREIMSRDELIKEFTLERVQKAGAIFNVEKLDWMNGHYINNLSNNDFISRASDYVPKSWKLNENIVESVKSRLKKFDDLKDLIDFYFELPDYDKNLLKWKNMSFTQVSENLKFALSHLESISERDFNKKILEVKLLELFPKEKRGEFFWPLRVALSGKESSPAPFEIMASIGKQESLRRVELALNMANA